MTELFKKIFIEWGRDLQLTNRQLKKLDALKYADIKELILMSYNQGKLSQLKDEWDFLYNTFPYDIKVDKRLSEIGEKIKDLEKKE
jgi:hypothetical protein